MQELHGNLAEGELKEIFGERSRDLATVCQSLAEFAIFAAADTRGSSRSMELKIAISRDTLARYCDFIYISRTRFW